MGLTFLSVLVCCGAASASDPAASVVISPQNPEMGVGESITVTAQGYDNNGNPVQIQDPNWEWDPQYGTLTVDANNPCQASFQATSPGTGYVLCYEGPPSQQIAYGSTDITIQGGGAYLARIDVTPTTTTLRVGDTTVFTATGYDQNGNVYNIDPIWSTNGGTIDQNGNYDATIPGDFNVYASVSGGTVTGTGNVQVKEAPYLATIVVTPNPVTLELGQTQWFGATGYDQYGNEYSINPVWSCSFGEISKGGTYKPTDIGLYTVVAFAEGKSGSASVEVIAAKPPRLTSISVLPSSMRSYTGLGHFSATGYDQFGNVYPITPTWSVSGGSITQDGWFSGSAIGFYMITASAEGVNGYASYEITNTPIGKISTWGMSTINNGYGYGTTGYLDDLRNNKVKYLINNGYGYAIPDYTTSTQSAITPATPTAQQDITSSPLLYLGGALVAVLAALGIYKLR